MIFDCSMAVKIQDLLDLDDGKLLIGYRFKGLLGNPPGFKTRKQFSLPGKANWKHGSIRQTTPKRRVKLAA